MKTINVIYPKDGWILERMAHAIGSNLDNVRLLPANTEKISELINEPRVINYYINYYFFREKSKNPDLVWFTHIEESRPELVKHFSWALSNCDYGIFNSKKYHAASGLSKNRSCVIHPGVEQNIFSNRLVLGVIGRPYNKTNRKNPGLLQKINDLDFVDLRFTGGDLPQEHLPIFYRMIDYVLTTSSIEGGPMSLLEGLAAGKKSIFPKNVGLWEEFKDHVITYDLDNFEGLVRLLRKLHRKKLALTNLVRHCTWEQFAESHRKVFEKYY